jgi:hypothetical protein
MVVARPLSGEANPFDLLIIETLRSFFPEIYDQVRRNGEALTGSDPYWLSRSYSEDQIKVGRKQLLDGLYNKLYSTEESKPISELLCWLFPEFALHMSSSVGRSRFGIDRDPSIAEREKRISHEDFFPVYFGHRVPEALYSETEVRAFIRGMNDSGSSAEARQLFKRTLNSIPKGDPRRLSFLHRVLNSIGRLNDSAAKALALAVSEEASEYSYDAILPSAAEAGKAMAIVFEIAQHFSQGLEAQRVLEDSITFATDDTFAVRLLTFSTAPGRNKILRDFSHVRPDALKSAFVQRMRQRYVEHFDALEPFLAQCDRSAFVLWAENSDEDRDAEVGFWRRYVGESRKRLAKMCDILFPSGTLWEGDPSPHLDRLFPLEELKTLNERLPTDSTLGEGEVRALDRMSRLIRGDFQGGVGFDQLAGL